MFNIICVMVVVETIFHLNGSQTCQTKLCIPLAVHFVVCFAEIPKGRPEKKSYGSPLKAGNLVFFSL